MDVLSKEDTRKFVLDKLIEIINDPEQKTRDILKSIELMGKEHGMFIEQKNIKVDIQALVSNMDQRVLKELAGEVIEGELVEGTKGLLSDGKKR